MRSIMYEKAEYCPLELACTVPLVDSPIETVCSCKQKQFYQQLKFSFLHIIRSYRASSFLQSLSWPAIVFIFCSIRACYCVCMVSMTYRYHMINGIFNCISDV